MPGPRNWLRNRPDPTNGLPGCASSLAPAKVREWLFRFPRKDDAPRSPRSENSTFPSPYVRDCPRVSTDSHTAAPSQIALQTTSPLGATDAKRGPAPRAKSAPEKKRFRPHVYGHLVKLVSMPEGPPRGCQDPRWGRTQSSLGFFFLSPVPRGGCRAPSISVPGSKLCPLGRSLTILPARPNRQPPTTRYWG